MPVLGILLAFAGYGLMVQGYVWVRRYAITPAQIWSPTGYYTGQWPPETVPDSGDTAIGGALTTPSSAIGGGLNNAAIGGGLQNRTTAIGGGLN